MFNQWMQINVVIKGEQSTLPVASVMTHGFGDDALFTPTQQSEASIVYGKV